MPKLIHAKDPYQERQRLIWLGLDSCVQHILDLLLQGGRAIEPGGRCETFAATCARDRTQTPPIADLEVVLVDVLLQTGSEVAMDQNKRLECWVARLCCNPSAHLHGGHPA
jgi:hypothetical protein